jgi:hypothetical protein
LIWICKLTQLQVDNGVIIKIPLLDGTTFSLNTKDIKITNGILTPEQIRKDPTLLEIKDNEQICRKCYKIKNILKQ